MKLINPSTLSLLFTSFVLATFNPFEEQQQEQIPQKDSFSQPLTNLEPAAGFISPDTCTVNDGCNDSFSKIDAVNSAIRPAVSSLVTTEFFKFFKLQLYKECPFWQENPMCFSPSCAVDVKEDLKDYSLSETSVEVQYNCDYCNTSEESQDDAVYVDLTLNPERFSGYGGPEAGRIWSAIYQENCFNKPKSEQISSDTSPALQFNNKYLNLLASWSNRLQRNKNIGNYERLAQLMNQEDDQCIEKRVFYRLISGMHASIATHLSFEWLNTAKKNARFEPNLQLWMERVGYFGDRLANIYFNYSLVLKSIIKLADHLSQIQFSASNKEKDYLLDIISAVKPYEKSVFDESVLFNYEDDLSNNLLKNEFRANFKNVSTLMDCVGCERCRLWGKVQTLGYGTALKVLFELNDDNGSFNVSSLKRSEIVALINTFDRLSKSLSIISYFRDQWNSQKEPAVEGDVGDEFFDDNYKVISYQQKIFKKGRKGQSLEGSAEEKNEVKQEVKEPKVELKEEAKEIKKKPVEETKDNADIQAVKEAKVEDSKKNLQKLFKKKKNEFQSPGTKGRALWESDLIRFEDEEEEDLENLSAEEIRYREIFHNSLKLKQSIRQEDKTFNDYFYETIEEFRDAFRFIFTAYRDFPVNIYKMIIVHLESYWNWFIGNEEFFLRKKKELSRIDRY